MSVSMRRYCGGPADIGTARHLIAGQLDGIVAWETCQLAVLLTSEIVTNAVVHAGSVFVLRLTVRPDTIRIDVRDRSTHLPHLRHPAASEEHGRGLHLVHAFASRWGCEPAASGKSVWFELDR
ncbi:MAG: ATP-binding protein [Egibacteraceae bacterium]